MPIIYFYISLISNLPLHKHHHFQVGIHPQSSRPFLEVHRNFRPLPVIVPCIPNPEFLLIYKSSKIFIYNILHCKHKHINTNKMKQCYNISTNPSPQVHVYHMNQSQTQPLFADRPGTF